MKCPKCQAQMWAAILGSICPDCGFTVSLARTCPHCKKITRARVDGKPGQICPMCGDVGAVAEIATERPPYRSARHALEALMEVRSSGMASSLGRDMDRAAIGQVQSANYNQLSREHVTIGNLIPAWESLDPEIQLILELSVSVADWLNQARKCRACGHVYGPTGCRCQRCQAAYNVDDPHCPRCGDHRSWPNWPREMHADGTEKVNGKHICPKCGKSAGYHEVAEKARTIAGEVSAYRLALFVRDHHRQPFTRETGADFNEDMKIGYCPACGGWKRLASPRVDLCKCSTPRPRIRWTLRPSWNQIAGMTTGAMGRWENTLRRRGLI